MGEAIDVAERLLEVLADPSIVNVPVEINEAVAKLGNRPERFPERLIEDALAYENDEAVGVVLRETQIL